jgi:ABC-2 type transport system ATP-binding protein
MIELQRVTKQYRRRRPAALHDVSLQVPDGAVWAVVGPNGAGKSTLLALVLGFIRATRGHVLLAGAAPRDYLRDCGAGYLPEQFRVPGEWRTRDTLRMLGRLGGRPAGEADRVISQFGLEPHLAKRTDELSRGLLQRVGLAQALLHRRPLIVLDEPTEGLDPVWRIRLRDVLAGLRAEGSTVLMASHDLGEVERVADRAVLLEKGGIRDIIDTSTDDPPASYRIRLAAPFETVAEAFPDADRDAEGTSFTVSVTGPGELSQRVGALITLGAVITAVEPLRRPLEERVRDTLERDTLERDT